MHFWKFEVEQHQIGSYSTLQHRHRFRVVMRVMQGSTDLVPRTVLAENARELRVVLHDEDAKRSTEGM